MSHLRGMLLVIGLGLLVLGVIQPSREVSTAAGTGCGSAWSAWRDAGSSEACESVGAATVRRGGYAAGAGVLLLTLLAVVPRRTTIPTLGDPGGGR